MEYAFDEGAYRGHIEWLLEHEPAGLFAAGGTGEFFSLTLEEFARVVRAAVEQTNGRVPVVAGCGYGTAMAKQFAQAAEAAGADGLLLLPPYLLNADPAGLVAHVEAVCAATKLGVIFYNRDNAILNDAALERLCARCANLVGFKDGYGDIELMTRIYARMGERLTYIGGLPTAETFALPYLEMGVTTYSSAIFNFLPKFAQGFYAAVRRRDHEEVYQATARVCAAVYRHSQPAQGVCGLDCEGGDARGGQAGGAGADAADGPGCGRDGCAGEADCGAGHERGQVGRAARFRREDDAHSLPDCGDAVYRELVQLWRSRGDVGGRRGHAEGAGAEPGEDGDPALGLWVVVCLRATAFGRIAGPVRIEAGVRHQHCGVVGVRVPDRAGRASFRRHGRSA